MQCLDHAGWQELPDGSLQSSDGTVFRRTPQKVTRRSGREWVAAGSPVITDVYPEGVVVAEGDAARERWAEIAPRLAVGRRRWTGDLTWVVRIWEADNGRTLLRCDGDGCP